MIAHLAGATPPHPVVCTYYGKATYRNRGIHYRQARRKGIGMDTRHDMCRVNTEEGTIRYAN